MELKKKTIEAYGIRFSIEEQGSEVARARLYILRNNLHEQPFGFIEDVFVDESQRGKGLAGAMLEQMIAEAKAQNCYKIVDTSRHERKNVHRLYERLGFYNHGLEFRMDLPKSS